MGNTWRESQAWCPASRPLAKKGNLAREKLGEERDDFRPVEEAEVAVREDVTSLRLGRWVPR